MDANLSSRVFVSLLVVSAIPGNEPSGTPLEQIGTFKGQETSWSVIMLAACRCNSPVWMLIFFLPPRVGL